MHYDYILDGGSNYSATSQSFYFRDIIENEFEESADNLLYK
jgi:hypothetical protein